MSAALHCWIPSWAAPPPHRGLCAYKTPPHGPGRFNAPASRGGSRDSRPEPRDDVTHVLARLSRDRVPRPLRTWDGESRSLPASLRGPARHVTAIRDAVCGACTIQVRLQVRLQVRGPLRSGRLSAAAGDNRRTR